MMSEVGCWAGCWRWRINGSGANRFGNLERTGIHGEPGVDSLSMNRIAAYCLVIACASWGHIQSGSFSVKSGTVYTPGQNVTLSWSASIDHNKSNYNLWFSSDSGKTWTTVKSGIPGQAAGVLVNYSWTVPSQPTTKGMLRVFQVFGGTVASSPSSPGDYTLFSPVFEIKATSSVASTLSVPALLQLHGDRLEVRLVAEGRAAFLDVLNLDGSLERSWTLARSGSGAQSIDLRLSELGIRHRSILCLRVDGRVIARQVVGPVFGAVR